MGRIKRPFLSYLIYQMIMQIPLTDSGFHCLFHSHDGRTHQVEVHGDHFIME